MDGLFLGKSVFQMDDLGATPILGNLKNVLFQISQWDKISRDLTSACPLLGFPGKAIADGGVSGLGWIADSRTNSKLGPDRRLQ